MLKIFIVYVTRRALFFKKGGEGGEAPFFMKKKVLGFSWWCRG